MASKASSRAFGPRFGVSSLSLLVFWLGLLGSVGSSVGLGGLGGLIILLSFLLVLIVNTLRSFIISIGLASAAVGTKERPLLSSRICALVSGSPERFMILAFAHSKQWGLVHLSGTWTGCLEVSLVLVLRFLCLSDCLFFCCCWCCCCCCVGCDFDCDCTIRVFVVCDCVG